jgi:anaerobic magnesium-protoporphyrin IX monomethyl ester cyclase
MLFVEEALPRENPEGPLPVSRSVMKIRLIEPEPPGMHVWAKVLLPRLGLPIIAATLKSHGHDVLVYNPTMAPIDWEDVYTSDLVGLSSTTSTASTAYQFADELRARGIPVIIGGSHVTFMAEEALGHADYVARGEGGEELMLELIEALDGSRRLEDVGGLSFRQDGETVDNPLRERCIDLDTLPFPDLSLLVGNERLQTMPIMTSWGCPFACNFCSVTAMFGRKYRFRSAESVIAELEDKRPRRIFFYDDNMAADKKRLKRLLTMMVERNLVIPWSAQVRTDVVRDPELLDLMRRTGCELVYLGLESVNQATLDGYEKSQTVEDIERAIKVLHDFGIKSHGMFVLGADTDTVQTVRDTVTFAIKNKIDTVMLNILTPLPGTPQFEELDATGRIFDKRWELYDAHHVVFEPKLMTPYELQIEVLRGYMRFYSLRTWLKYIFTFRFTKQLLFHGWGMVIIRNWRKDERNKAFIKALKRMWPRPTPPGTVRSVSAGGESRRS